MQRIKQKLHMNKNRVARLGLLCFGLLWMTCVQGQKDLSNRGKEFWVSYPFNWFFENGNSQEMVLYFSAEEDAVVTLTSHVGANTWTRTYTVPAGTVTISDYIPKSGLYDSRLYDFAYPAGNGGQGVYNKAIHIESTTPIVAYAHYIGSATSGASMLFPVEAYGYVYTTLNNKNFYGSQPANTYFYVMASHDNTVVEITPKVLTRSELPAAPGGRPAGAPFTVTLNRGQSFQAIARVTAGDLTGSKIRSIANSAGVCYPIAVFAGTSRTGLACSGNGGSGDFIMQQCFPSQAWGKRYFTAPTSNSTGANSFMTNIYRILVKDPTTVVKRNGTQIPIGTLIGGDYYEYNSGTADYIEADKPIMVAQYMPSTGGCPNTSGDGDPEMIYISPIEQATKRVGFYRNDEENINTNYLTLIIPNDGTALSSLRIDGDPLSAIPAVQRHTYTHPQNSRYTVVVRRWLASKSQSVVSSDSAFTSITYGIGSVESYGYNGGTLINNLNAYSSIQNPLDPTHPQHEFTCEQTPVTISALMAYQPTRMEWKLSTLAGIVTPAADVIDNSPTSTGTQLVNGVTYYKYTLPGTYLFNTPGEHEIPILATHPSIENCNNTEEVKIYIEVKPKPKADFSIDHPTGCSLDTVFLHAVNATTDGFTLNTWNWSFPGGATTTGKDTLHVFAAGAAQPVTLSVVTAEGCASDTTKDITVFAPPVSAVAVAPPVICEDNTVNFTPTASYAGPVAVNGWYWNFGNGNTADLTTATPATVTYPDYGNYTVKHVVRVSPLCVSDTVETIVNVHAKPRVDIAYPAGCLPVTGEVQFTNNTTTPDGQTLTSHSWNFGDANATPANPNTSAAVSPTHIYTAYGNYDINYIVTSSEGCVKDTIIKATFNVSPVLDFPAVAAVCENQAAFALPAVTVTNGVPGTGAFSGAGVDASNGTFNPATAGAGSHVVTYTFTSTANCVITATRTIVVHPRPTAAFTIPAGACLPASGQVTFDNTSTIVGEDPATLTWSWNFDDPAATPANPNTSTAFEPSHNFQEGSYDISLEAVSQNGCRHTITSTQAFALTPVVTYPALAGICVNEAAVSVATATATVGGVPQTGGTYSGPGTTAAGMFDPAAAGAGIHTITYSFTSAGGCPSTATSTIEVYAKPVAAFTFPSGCLAADGSLQFTSTSTGATSWSWMFDDPNASSGNDNTSALENPVHRFREGTYDIELEVGSADGCRDKTTVQAVLGVTPVVTYPALSNVCESAPAFSIASATATVAGVTQTGGTYSGPGTTAAGMFNPATAGSGTHTITYSFTSAGGCTSTITSTINVYPRPVASFTATPGVCLNDDVTFQSTSTISSGAIQTWNWNLGNSSAPSYTNDAPFDVTYATAGNYTVQLTAVSDQNCTSLPVSQTITVHPLPVASFTPPGDICLPGSASFTNTSTGAATYLWNFGDGTGTSTVKDPSYTYAGAGSYPVTLTAYSSFGCEHTSAPVVVDDFYEKPVANFAVNPSELCQGTNTDFINQSTNNVGTITSWKWDFDDGSPVFTSANPVKQFANPGTYDVTLTVSNNAGCVSDPFVRTVRVHLQPKIDAGRSFVVPMGTPVRFEATANSQSLTFNWTPAAGLDNATILNPTITATADQVYTLTATGDYNCTATDELTVKILKPIRVPNVFSPNGDNIHDRWLIPNLTDYPGATVEIFNRYGQQVFYTVGYNTPWDGTYKGKDVPVGTYYYVIKLENGFKPQTGSVTVIR
ncbi:MAG: PKD domain-containing protein [Terrimonas ferruginea]|jgi:gliding motility-associated-like protein|uniref:PKD domain-containing protein n=1 Tax=Terrimonas ferruginea TaxID=249 RepID=UPI000A8F1EC1|nr:PKD domain-containing protein [Terrimonas ferruginea]MBN8783208.1 PKD domain-containing protein [Terrimonas ferruginea]